MTCNATPPNYADPPPRCGLPRGHDGPHQTTAQKVSLGGLFGLIDPGDEWAADA